MTSRSSDYIIHGGLVVRGTGVTREDIVVKDGKICADAEQYRLEDARRVIDASGLYVMPGIVDAHNHPVYADRIETFSLSAAFGGITTVVPFISNRRREGVEGTVSDIIREFMDEAAETSYLDYAIHAILLGDDDVEDQVPEMMGMGVISFKMYMTYPRRGMMMPDDRMLKAMELAAADGGIAMVHAENGYCIDYLVDKMTEEGHTGREHYAPSQPRILEIEAANRAATYSEVTGCPLYIVHLSAREMLGVLERFRGGDTQLFAETCPQYLALTNQKMLDFGALAKIGPPLREREDNEAMWRGLSSHLIDTIASDFCGHKKSQKASYDAETDPDKRSVDIRRDIRGELGGADAVRRLPSRRQYGADNPAAPSAGTVREPGEDIRSVPEEGIAGRGHGRGHRAIRSGSRAHAIRGGAALPCRLHDVRGHGCHRAADNDDAAWRDTGGERRDAQAEGTRRIPAGQSRPRRIRAERT